MRQLDNWFRAYIEYSQASDAPRLYHTWVGLATLAGAVRAHTYIDIGYSRLYPNLYVCLVGPSGGRKTTAADIGVNLLSHVDGIRIKRDKITPERIIRYLSEGIDLKSIDDQKATFDDTRNLFIYAPELATLIGTSSYSSVVIEILTRLYDNTPFEYSLVSQEDVKIEKFNVNVLACSTPEWLARGIDPDSIGGGFIGRFLLPTNTSYETIKFRALPKLTEEQLRLENMLINDLQHIATLEGEVRLDEESYREYSEWFESQAYMQDIVLDKGYFVRKPIHVLKVAMLLSLAASDDMIIHYQQYKAARSLVELLDKKVEDALLYIGATDELRVQQLILELLEVKPRTYGELVGFTRKYTRSLYGLDNALNTLIAGKLIVKKATSKDVVFELEKDVKERKIKEIAEAMGRLASEIGR